MQTRFRHSILTRLGFVMAAITLLGVISMATSLYTAETIQGQAAAINEAGSLRMRSYRIASSLSEDVFYDRVHWQTTYQQIQEFEEHLRGTRLVGALPPSETHPTRRAYRQIEQQWRQDIRPVFDIYLDGIIGPGMPISEDAVTNLRAQYFLVVADFVGTIDHFVALMEQDAELKIQRLRLHQAITLLFTLVMVVIALALLYWRVRLPLKDLLHAAQQAQNREFGFRIQYNSQDELGELAQTFNSMAEDLSRIYAELEQRVQQKTRDLENTNRSLELLYRTVKRLNESASPHRVFNEILHDIEQLLGCGHGTICLRDNPQQSAAKLASTFNALDLSRKICARSDCMHCFNSSNQEQIISLAETSHTCKDVLVLPIRDQNQQLGVLLLEPGAANHFEPWQKHLLETICQHIGMALNAAQTATHKRRMALVEERSIIARELHDSLAQSLTFMKIQVSYLQKLINEAHDREAASNTIAELRLGLQSAYRELRELLTTFRLKIDTENFADTLNETIAEFNARGSTRILCDNQLPYCKLSANEEINLLQLIREALSNILHHAEASEARVELRQQNEQIKIGIYDNGKGMPDNPERQQHYGLAIMKERAHSIGGQIEIKTSPQNGVGIEMIFAPEHPALPMDTTHE